MSAAIDEYQGAVQVVVAADAALMRGVSTEREAHRRTRCTDRTHRHRPQTDGNARARVAGVSSDPYILGCLYDAAEAEAKRLRLSEDPDERRAARQFAKALREVEASGERLIEWRAQRARVAGGRLF